MATAVLERPRVPVSNMFEKAKNFFNKKLNKAKEFFQSSNSSVQKPQEREINIEDTIKILSKIYDTKTIIEIYKQRIYENTVIIRELEYRINISKNEKEIKKLTEEMQEAYKNATIDRYIYNVKSEELKKQEIDNIKKEEPTNEKGTIIIKEESEKDTNIINEEQPINGQPENPAPNNGSSNNNNNPHENEEYNKLYIETAAFLEQQVEYSTKRLNRTSNIIGIIGQINEEIPELNKRNSQISYNNYILQKNLQYEQQINKKIAENIKQLVIINPNFNIMKEYGKIVEKMPTSSYDDIRKYCYTILDKHYLLEKMVSSTNNENEQDILKGIMQNIDETLGILKNNVNNSERVNDILVDVNKELLAKYYPEQNITKTGDIEVEEPKKDDVIIIPPKEDETVETQQPIEEPIIEEQEEPQAEQTIEMSEDEQKNFLLKELEVLYSRLNNVNEVVDNPLPIGYDALIYFEDIAQSAKLKINEIKSKLKKLSNVTPEDLEDKEVFPNPVETFVGAHNENIIKAKEELITLYSEEETEEINSKIEKITKYIDKENSLIQRRLIFEKRKDKSFNILSILSAIDDKEVKKRTTVILPVDQTITTTSQDEQIEIVNEEDKKNDDAELTMQSDKIKIKIKKIKVKDTQKISQINNLLETCELYKVTTFKKSIKIKYNKQLLEELRQLQAELKIVIETEKSPTYTTSENEKGEIVNMISDINDFKSITAVVESDGEVIKEENIYDGGLKM